MDFLVCIADTYIEIKTVYLYTWYLCRNYIIKEDVVPELVIATEKTEISSFRQRLIAEFSEQLELDGEEFIESILIHHKITEAFLDKSILLMHGSVVVTDKEAFMITGPSGEGKTYRSRLWLAYIPNSYFLNGDKPFILFKNNCIYACGSPWCGKERFNSNKVIPLRAILFLSRSNKNSVTKISYSEAFSELIKQTFFPTNSEKQLHVFRLLNQLERKVSFYRFLSTENPDAVKMAYRIASGKVNDVDIQSNCL